MKYLYETPEPDPYPNAVRVKGYPGIAWHILGFHIEADEDTEFTGFFNRTESLVAVMVGDDRHHLIDPDDVTPLNRDEYCGVCGQIGCCHG